MDNRSSKSPRRPKKEHDFSTVAYRVVQEAIAEGEPTTVEEPAESEPTPEERHKMAVALGRAGGKKGGKARAAKLTAEQRSEIAKKAAAKRWRKDRS